MTPDPKRIEDPHFERCISLPQENEEFNLAVYRSHTRFWFRYVGWTGIVIIPFSCLVMGSIAIRDKERILFWLGVFLFGCTGLHIYWLIASNFWFHRRHRGFSKSEVESIRWVEITICPIGCGINAGGFQALFPWDRISYLWQFSDCWMLIPTRKQFDLYLPLPTSILDEECKRFIADQVDKHGGLVQENPKMGIGLWYLQRAF